MSKRTAWIVYGCAGVFGFAILLTLEVLANEGPFRPALLLFESIELLVIIGTAVGTTVLFNRFQAQREEQAGLRDELERARLQGQLWREKAQKHIQGLSAAIQEQFDQWGLSPAESEVAMLMLKGFSHKEIARLRNSGEQTVRQQARVVYAKADVTSRHAFCAFFLEDLLLPPDEEERDAAAPETADAGGAPR